MHDAIIQNLRDSFDNVHDISVHLTMETRKSMLAIIRSIFKLGIKELDSIFNKNCINNTNFNNSLKDDEFNNN